MNKLLKLKFFECMILHIIYTKFYFFGEIQISRKIAEYFFKQNQYIFEQNT